MRGVIPILALLVPQSWYHPTCIPPQSTSPMGDSSPAPLQHPAHPSGPPCGQGSSWGNGPATASHTAQPQPTGHRPVWGGCSSSPRVLPAPQGAPGPPRQHKGMLQPPQGCYQPPHSGLSPRPRLCGPACAVQASSPQGCGSPWASLHRPSLQASFRHRMTKGSSQGAGGCDPTILPPSAPADGGET